MAILIDLFTELGGWDLAKIRAPSGARSLIVGHMVWTGKRVRARVACSEHRQGGIRRARPDVFPEIKFTDYHLVALVLPNAHEGSSHLWYELRQGAIA